MFKLFRQSRAPLPNSAVTEFASAYVTEEDIFACFRLLFGRRPNAKELQQHFGQIGGDLQELVARFVTSPEFIARTMLPPRSHQEESHLSATSYHEVHKKSDSRTTTAADIYYCFRLLLGRPPNREEWKGHVSQAGIELDRVVSNYTSSLEFAQRKLVRAATTGTISLTTQNGFKLYASNDDAAVGQHVIGGAYEPDVSAVIRTRLRTGMTMIDIGANIGYFTMLAASIVGASGRVVAVEPNPSNARMLEASRRANGFSHVSLCQAAAAPATGLLVLNTSYSNGTTTSIDDDLERLLTAETVACLPVDSLFDPQAHIDLIKIDVEGAEHTALLGCRRILREHRPIIVSEFAPSMLAGISDISGPDYLRWLIDQGYLLSVISPDGSTQPANCDIGAIMQIYREREADHIDILAVPNETILNSN